MFRIMCWSRFVVGFGCVMVMLSAVSCSEELEHGNSMVSEVRKQIVRLSVTGGRPDADTRSILADESVETRITDVTLASYDSKGVLVNALYHQKTDVAMSVYVSGSDVCTIYALANMGDMTTKFPDNEADVPDVTYMLETYGDVAVKGIPMCGVLKGYSYEEGKVADVSVERLFAKLSVRILHTGLSDANDKEIYAYNLSNKSVYLRQANRRLKPFASKGSVAENEEDILDVSDYNPDLADLGSYQGALKPADWGPGMGYVQDTTVVLYVPENVQGVLLADNTDPIRKVGDAIPEFERLCTYLEFNAYKPEKADGYGGDITYRCYLGEDNVSDFSIRRNCCYDLTMNFTDEGFLLDSWKVVKGEGWLDNRVLHFVDGPCVIYPGTTANVLVHFNRSGLSDNSDSNGMVDDMVCEFDEADMAAAGLTCMFMGAEKMVGDNGYEDYYFKVTASADAKTGTVFPIKVSLKDGSKSDVALVHVAEIGELTPVWDFCPEYVSQTGTMVIAGVVDELLPLAVSVSDNSILSCTKEDDTSFVIRALRAGQANVTVSDSSGSQTLSLSFDIVAPKLKVSDIYIALAPDGGTGTLDYFYADREGNALTNVDESVYNAFLKPKVSGCGYISAESDRSSVDMYVERLTCDGQEISAGSYYDISISARDCPGAGTHDMRAYIVDPFSCVSMSYKDRIDDYTLFDFNDVPSAVRDYFADEISAKVNLVYDVQEVDADEAYISASLESAWEGVFSNENEVFVTDYNHSDPNSTLGSSVSVCQGVVSSSSKHGAGLHHLKLKVMNRYSGEFLSKTVASLDVYVHTAIGAEASFGRLVCSYPSEGVASTVAGIYNGVTGFDLYDTSSSDMICYMDVSVKYLTDVGNVYVFDRMQQGQGAYTNVMNGLDVVRPSVGDGEIDGNRRMMYSVCTDGGQRIAVCGEPYGTRKGLETVLYRALAMQTYSTALDQTQLNSLFFGYTSQHKVASYAPCYEIHDMNMGSDMTKNVVSKNYPFYFSPTSCMPYRDDSGRGYHVIHALDVIAPETNGWINLL